MRIQIVEHQQVTEGLCDSQFGIDPYNLWSSYVIIPVDGNINIFIGHFICDRFLSYFHHQTEQPHYLSLMHFSMDCNQEMRLLSYDRRRVGSLG